MKYMLGTNICIYAMKNKPEIVQKKILENLKAGICISTITMSELAHGVYKSVNKEKNFDALLSFLIEIEILPFDIKASFEYGKICAYLQKNGTPIGPLDTLIAAHAFSQNLTLVTNNVREFSRVPELKIENWTE